MKIIVKIMLVMFLLFIATPTIVSVLQKKADMSSFFTIDEEEESLFSLDAIKIFRENYVVFLSIDFEGLQIIHFSILNDRKITSIKINLFSPPPDFI